MEKQMQHMSEKKIYFSDRYLLLISMLYSFGIFWVVYLFSYPTWEAADDFMISGILQGTSGESSPYTLVMGYLLSWLIYHLQILIPQLNWLTLFELFSVWVSFSFLSWFFIRKRTIEGYVAFILFPLLFEILFYTSLNYTRSACILSFTGLMLIWFFSSEKYSIPGIVCGTILFLLGSLFRFACIYIAIPYVGILVVEHYWKNRKVFWKEKYKGCLPIFLLLGTLVICFSLYGFHKLKYREFAEKTDYIEFNMARARGYDYLPQNYEDYAAEFKDIGVSRNDYQMIKLSLIYDQYFSEGLYKKIAQINFSENESLNSKLKNVASRFWKNLVYYNQGKNSGKYNTFYLIFYFAVLSFVFLKKENIFTYLCTVGGTAFFIVYFIWTGRFPPWIQGSLYLIAGFMFIYLILESEIKIKDAFKERKRWIQCTSLFVGMACMLICVTSDPQKKIKVLERKEIDLNLAEALEYMKHDSENIYLIDNFSGCPFPIMNVYGSLRGMERNSWNNIMRVGSWYLKHPVLESQLKDTGLKSPVHDLINENIYLLTNTGFPYLEIYRTFFAEHYGEYIYAKEKSQWGDYAIYSLYTVERENLY